jgi:hypothetical protein
MEEYRISREELLELLEARNRLAALESGGVDNWNWYSDSLHDYLKEDYENNREAFVKEFNIDPEDEDEFKMDFDFHQVALLELSGYEVIKE